MDSRILQSKILLIPYGSQIYLPGFGVLFVTRKLHLPNRIHQYNFFFGKHFNRFINYKFSLNIFYKLTDC